MKKGFTLIELIAIIVVIGVLGVITMPVVSNVIVKNQEKAHNAQITFIENATKMWAVYNTVYDTEYVTVQELIDGGYIEQDKILDPATKKDIVGCVKVTFNETYNQYEYKFGEYDECGTKTYYIEHARAISLNSYITGTVLNDKYCLITGRSSNGCIYGLANGIFNTQESCEAAAALSTSLNARCQFFDSVEVYNGIYSDDYDLFNATIFTKVTATKTNIVDASICFKYSNGLMCVPIIHGNEFLTYDYATLKSIASEYEEHDISGHPALSFDISDVNNQFTGQAISATHDFWIAKLWEATDEDEYQESCSSSAVNGISCSYAN